MSDLFHSVEVSSWIHILHFTIWKTGRVENVTFGNTGPCVSARNKVRCDGAVDMESFHFAVNTEFRCMFHSIQNFIPFFHLWKCTVSNQRNDQECLCENERLTTNLLRPCYHKILTQKKTNSYTESNHGSWKTLAILAWEIQSWVLIGTHRCSIRKYTLEDAVDDIKI